MKRSVSKWKDIRLLDFPHFLGVLVLVLLVTHCATGISESLHDASEPGEEDYDYLDRDASIPPQYLTNDNGSISGVLPPVTPSGEFLPKGEDSTLDKKPSEQITQIVQTDPSAHKEQPLEGREGQNVPSQNPELPCNRKPYELRWICTLQDKHMRDFGFFVTVKDLIDLIYDPEVVGYLQRQCPPGVWCMSNDWGIRYEEPRYLDFCDLNVCLLNMHDSCLTLERELALSSLRMLCQMNQNNVSSNCVFSILKMLDVNMADIHRVADGGTNETSICRSQKDRILCSGPCNQMAQHLHCMSESCEQPAMPVLQEFGAWQWFFDMVDADSQCQADKADCHLFQPRESWVARMFHKTPILRPFEDTDGSTVVGVLFALVLALGGCGALVWFCAIRHKDRGGRYGKADYTEIISDVTSPLQAEEEMETMAMLPN